jgi:hypothetical protein
MWNEHDKQQLVDKYEEAIKRKEIAEYLRSMQGKYVATIGSSTPGMSPLSRVSSGSNSPFSGGLSRP